MRNTSVLAVTEAFSVIKRNDRKRSEIIPKTEISFEIVEHIGVLSTGSKGWTKELNLISWNGRAPKYDLREWSPEHDKIGKGVTLSKEELEALKDLLQKM